MIRTIPSVDEVVNALAREGYFHGVCDVRSDEELLDFVSTFGSPTPEPRDGTVVKEIAPMPSALATSNTLSSRHGFGAFPFHTDSAYWKKPARWLVLWCIAPGVARRTTILSDTRSWQLSDEEELALRNEVWVVRHVRDPFLCSHMARDGSIRADYACMYPATEGLDESRRIVENRLAQMPTRRISWEPHHVLVIDNWRVLHARGEAARPDPDRRLKRVLARAS